MYSYIIYRYRYRYRYIYIFLPTFSSGCFATCKVGSNSSTASPCQKDAGRCRKMREGRKEIINKGRKRKGRNEGRKKGRKKVREAEGR